MKPLLLSLLVLAAAACSGSAPDDADDDAPPPEVEAGRVKLAYPSTYTSNCTCTFCTVYCQVDGRTTKGGTCC